MLYEPLINISDARALSSSKQMMKKNFWIMKAGLERLARLIKVCGFLLQTKVYLFWERPA
jgi:hypothetical protein